MAGLSSIVLLGYLRCFVHALVILEPPAITPAPNLHQARAPVRAYELMDGVSTCGYEDGDPSKSWGAPAGYDCRVDTLNGLWGFCPTTVFVATDCGLGGYCFDQSSCTSGCGVLSGKSSITTWTWHVYSQAFLRFHIEGHGLVQDNCSNISFLQYPK